MSDFIQLNRQTFEEEIGFIGMSTAKPRDETSSVKSEPVIVVDIKSEPRDLVAINTGLLN